jgi:short-subunit dehydrogenase
MSLAKVDYANSTALVTGATSGIGRAIALELVSRGLVRLVIVARSEEKLNAVAAELKQASSALEVRTVAADLEKQDVGVEIQKQVEQAGWNIDILVPNAARAAKEVFASDLKTDTALATVDLNVRAVVDLSLRFLPGMAQRRSGGILNIGSTAGHQPVPFTATYAASKAFLISFSQAIREEQRDAGVRVACIVPGITQTNLGGPGQGERRGALDKVSIHQPDEVAKAAVDAYEANAPTQVVGFNNKVLQAAINVLPASTTAAVISKARGHPDQYS